MEKESDPSWPLGLVVCVVLSLMLVSWWCFGDVLLVSRNALMGMFVGEGKS